MPHHQFRAESDIFLPAESRQISSPAILDPDGLPAAAMEIAHLPTPLLFWVVHGQADVRIDGSDWSLGADEAVLIPIGATVSANTQRGSTAVPTWLPGTEVPTIKHFSLPREWEPIVLSRFAAGLGYLRPVEDFGELPLPLRVAESAESSQRIPPMPVDEDLNRLARFLLAYPSAPHTLGELASSLSLSPRTLQRRFQGATGMTFSAWLTLARVCASLDLLATDLSVEHIAHRVGFADPSAFSRAFRRIMDQSPREARHRLRQSDRDRADDARTPTFPTLPVSREGGEQSRTAPVPRLLPTQTWPRVNGSHVAIWVYRGTVDVTVDARHKVLHRGEALILPASTHHEVRAREDSLVLPLGYRPTGRLPATTKHLQVHRFRPETKAALLHGIVSTYTALRPRVPVANSLFDHVALHTIDTGDGASAHLPDTSSSITALLSCLARNPHAPFPAAYWADRLGMSGREFHRSVRIATGVPYPTWRRVSRMTFAREALLRGVPATSVAQQTGYSQLSSFSRAFSATFGAPPRHLASLSRADRNSLPEGPPALRARRAEQFGPSGHSRR